MRKTRKIVEHTTKVRAIRDYRGGMSLNQVANKYKVHYSTISNWNKDPRVLGGLSKFNAVTTYTDKYSTLLNVPKEVVDTTKNGHIHLVQSVTIDCNGQNVTLTRDDITRIANLQRWV